MKRWTMTGIAFAAAALLATGAEAHSYPAGVIAQPVSGSLRQPAPSSYTFQGTATWAGELDGEQAHGVYRCTADGPFQGTLAAGAEVDDPARYSRPNATFGGALSCYAEAAVGSAPWSFEVPVTGEIQGGLVSMRGPLGALTMACDGSLAADDIRLDGVQQGSVAASNYHVSLGCLIR